MYFNLTAVYRVLMISLIFGTFTLTVHNAASSSLITMHPTFNDMPLDLRKKSIEILIPALANTVTLHSYLKQAHWVIRGPGFISLHELFDKVGKDVLEAADEIAERIEQLGGNVQGTLHSAVKISTLPEYPIDSISTSEQLVALAKSISFCARLLRENIDTATALQDTVTAEIFTDIVRTLDKNLWFIESNLELTSFPTKQAL